MAQKRSRTSSKRLGVWIFGAYGGLATTVVVGARAIAKGLTAPQGLATETDVAREIAWRPMDRMVFGGHEIRSSNFADAAAEIHSKTGLKPPTVATSLVSGLKIHSMPASPAATKPMWQPHRSMRKK